MGTYEKALLNKQNLRGRASKGMPIVKYYNQFERHIVADATTQSKEKTNNFSPMGITPLPYALVLQQKKKREQNLAPLILPTNCFTKGIDIKCQHDKTSAIPWQL